SSLVFIDSVDCLVAAGAGVIADDLVFFDEPFFADGPLALAVRAAVQAGVSYHSAAGNEAEEHVEQPFRASPDSSFHDFLGGPVDNADDSVIAQAALPEVVAVGAIDVNDPGRNDVEPYSSRGPARVFFPAPATRPKPDLAGFDGVSISNAGGFPACPPSCAFFGTSPAT